MQDDGSAIRQEGQRLLHREEQTFYIDVEGPVVELLGDRAESGKLRDPGIVSSLPFSRLICANRRSRSPRFDTSPCMPVTFRPISFTAAANSASRRPVMKV